MAKLNTGAGSSALEAVKEWGEKLVAEKLLPIVNAISALNGYSAPIGDGTSTEFTVTHNLNTQSIIVQLWDSTGQGVPMWDMTIIDNNSVKVTFEDGAPSANGVSICILPVRMSSAS